MDVESIDIGGELFQPVQLGLASTPVVLRRPIVCEVLDRRELNPLRLIIDRLPFGGTPRRDPSMEIDDRLFANIDMKRPNGGFRVRGSRVDTHDPCPLSCVKRRFTPVLATCNHKATS